MERHENLKMWTKQSHAFIWKRIPLQILLNYEVIKYYTLIRNQKQVVIWRTFCIKS